MFALVLAISAAMNSSPLLIVLGASLSLLLPLIVAPVVFRGVEELGAVIVLRTLALISLLQFPVMALQRLTYEGLPFYREQGIEYVDTAFGTMFIKSDHVVGFLLISLLVFTLFNRTARYVLPYRVLLIPYWAFTILFTNSKISHLLLVVVVLIYSVDVIRRRVPSFILILLFLVAPIFVYVGSTHSRIDRWDIETIGVPYVDAVESEERLPRFAPIMIFLTQPVSIFGHGPFSYYNPISEVWGIRAGHSQMYSAYYDFGLAGVVLVISFLIATAWRMKQSVTEWWWYAFVLAAFLFLSEVLVTISILVFYFSFLSISSNLSRGLNAGLRDTARGGARWQGS
jgi:hypothetical protein